MEQNLIDILCGKETKDIYSKFKDIVKNVDNSNELYKHLDELVKLLDSNVSHIRLRSFTLLCHLSKWDNANKICKNIDAMEKVLSENKPTIVRQCLKELDVLLLNKPQLSQIFKEKLGKFDYKKFKESMAHLIEKDINKIINKKYDLREMTLEELWQLFPIILTKHNDDWEIWYKSECERIELFLNEEYMVKINHIGSTAVKGICAKPIIDILLEIPSKVSMDDVKKMLITNGYICMCEKENRKSFCRGYTINGFAKKVYHLHLRYYGDNDEIFFRNYLNENETVAREYEKLKLSLMEQYKYNRDGYTESKKEFVSKITRLAKQTYGER